MHYVDRGRKELYSKTVNQKLTIFNGKYNNRHWNVNQ